MAKTKKKVAAPGSAVVAALEEGWRFIQEIHPELPDVMMIIGSGVKSGGKSLRWGHWHAGQWQADGADDKTAEVFIGGEGMSRGAAEVFGTLVHEAAHGLAHARKVQDTDRTGRRHNKKFKAIAEELHLEVMLQGTRGWAHTEMTAMALEAYAEPINALEKALKVWRPLKDRQPKGGSGKLLKAVCACGLAVRASRKVFESTEVHCSSCGEEFAVQ